MDSLVTLTIDDREVTVPEGTTVLEAAKSVGSEHGPTRRRRAQEASRRLPILILFPLVFFFLPALLIIYLAPPLLHLFLLR